MQGLTVEQLDGYLWVTATRIGHRLRLDYRVDDARADGHDFYDGDDDLSGWTDDQIRELACDMLSIDRSHAHRIDGCPATPVGACLHHIRRVRRPIWREAAFSRSGKAALPATASRCVRPTWAPDLQRLPSFPGDLQAYGSLLVVTGSD